MSNEVLQNGDKPAERFLPIIERLGAEVGEVDAKDITTK